MSEVISRPHYDASENVVHWERIQDVEAILERNKQLRSMPQKSDWGRHIGTIPCVILEKWLNDEYARGNVSLRMFSSEFDQLVAMKLRDPEWKYLRTDK